MTGPPSNSRQWAALCLMLSLFLGGHSISIHAKSQQYRRIHSNSNSLARQKALVQVVHDDSQQHHRVNVKAFSFDQISRGGGTSLSASSSPNNANDSAWKTGLKNSIASGMAAACSKLILAPFDTLKTLQQQSLSGAGGAGLSLVEAARVILARPGGFLEFYAGIGVAVIGSMPSVGLYFGVYSYLKRRLTEYGSERFPNIPRTVYIALAAAIGNTIASASRVPYEVMKQNLQTQLYSSMGEALRDMSWSTLFPTGGIASQMLRDIPYAIVTLLCYEHMKAHWKPRAAEKFPEVSNGVWDMMVGGASGGVGSYVTNPMDVIKTRLQTSSQLYGGSIQTCVIETFREGGTSAFFRGSIPRLCHKVPANAFFFLFYELFRKLLRVDDDKQPSSSSTSKNKDS